MQRTHYYEASACPVLIRVPSLDKLPVEWKDAWNHKRIHHISLPCYSLECTVQVLFVDYEANCRIERILQHGCLFQAIANVQVDCENGDMNFESVHTARPG